MAKLTDKDPLTTPAEEDLTHIIDVSDTTGSPEGTSKRVTKRNYLLGTKVTVLNAATLLLDDSQDVLAVDYTNTGAVTITLPPASGAWDSTRNLGYSYIIKDTGVKAGLNNITINRSGADTIITDVAGQTSVVISNNGDTLHIQAKNASTWIVL